MSGLTVHPGANGVYTIAQHTIGGKPHWIKQQEGGTAFFLSRDTPKQCLSFSKTPPLRAVLQREGGWPAYHLYTVNEPRNGWVIGTDMTSHILIVVSP